MASRGVNKVILVGNLGNDPEVRYSQDVAIANVSLATSEVWNDKNTGEKRERTEWHRVVFFRRLAEIVEQYLSKGSKIYVEGRLQTRSWEQDGVKRYSTEIVAEQMQMLDSRGDGEASFSARDGRGSRASGGGQGRGGSGGGGSRSQQAGPERPAPPDEATATNFDDLDDDIPF